MPSSHQCLFKSTYSKVKLSGVHRDHNIEINIQGEACPYADACTFCYNEEEQEIWAWERRGLFNRTRLFTETVVDPVAHFLRQYQGTFFICCELHLEDPPSCHCPNKNVCSTIFFKHFLIIFFIIYYERSQNSQENKF